MCAPLVMEQVARSLSRRSFLASGLSALAGVALAQAQVPGKAFSRAVDLTHELSPEIPLFPGAEPMRITTLVTVRQNGYYGNRLDLWEHSGTHMDAPAHFVEGAPTAEKLPPSLLIAPLAVVHIHEKAAKDPDAQVTVDDLLAYERQYGRLPKGAFVAMHSGWEPGGRTPKPSSTKTPPVPSTSPGSPPRRRRFWCGSGRSWASAWTPSPWTLAPPRTSRPTSPSWERESTAWRTWPTWPRCLPQAPHLRGGPQAQERLRRPGAGPCGMVISWLQVPEEEALSEEVRALFAQFRERTGFVPNVARAFALSPRFLFMVYLEVLRNSLESFSPTGRFSDTAPLRPLTVLSAFDERVRQARIDLKRTYTNAFVEQALKVIK